MLALRGVSCAIGAVPLVEGISTTIAPGAITAVVGRNGAGKTTLLQAMAGVRAPSRGQVTLAGRDLRAYARRALAREMTYLPQDVAVEFPFSVREIVAMGRHPHLGRFAATGDGDEAIVARALDRLGVGNLGERAFPSLSAGERQRVLLARSLATQAPVLVLDEPTASLDVGHALELFELLRALAHDGATIVVAVHDLTLAARYAQRCIVLDAGRCIRDGSVDDALAAPVVESIFGIRVRVVILDDGTRTLAFTLREPGARVPPSLERSPRRSHG